MLCYKKIKKLFFISACLLVWSSFAHTAFANNTPATVANNANALVIKSAELLPTDDAYVLNADAELKFSEEVEQAIIKGFDLNFLIEFQLFSPRKYWFDDEIVTVSHRVSLSYHALSRQYLVVKGEQQKTFATAEEAKEELVKIRDLKVLLKTDVEKGEVYKAALLMRLDHSKLPKALQVDAMSSNDWKISSQRFEWSPNLFK